MESDSGGKDKEKVDREKTAEEMEISATNGPGNEMADSQQQPEENTGPPQLPPLVSQRSGGDEGREASAVVKEAIEQPTPESTGDPPQHTHSLTTT